MNIKAKIQRLLVSKLTGVSLHYGADGKLLVSYVTMGFETDKPVLIDSKTEMNTLEKFSDDYDASIPIWLTLTGRSVITRKLESDPGQQYLNHVLPNVKEEDFLVSVCRASGDSVFVSAIRNDAFDKIYQVLHSSGVTILGVSLGPVPVKLLSVSELLKETKVNVPGYNIELSGGDIDMLDAQEDYQSIEYSIGNESIHSNLLIPFSTSLSYLVNQTGVDELIGDGFASDEEEFKGRKINQWAIYGALVILFLTLLINFFRFNSVNSKYQVLSEKMSFQQSFFARRDSLKNELNLKNQMVKQMGLSEHTEWGFYIDRIAATVPKGIGLEVLQVNPVNEKIRPDEAIGFDQHIYIEGYSKGSIILNEWIMQLKELDWLKDVQMIQYEKVEQKGFFELQISY